MTRESHVKKHRGRCRASGKCARLRTNGKANKTAELDDDFGAQTADFAQKWLNPAAEVTDRHE
jgi:hypothetical protein